MPGKPHHWPDFGDVQKKVTSDFMRLVYAKTGPDSPEVRLVTEIYSRLQQLDILVELISESLGKIESWNPEDENRIEKVATYKDASARSILFVESFYVFSFRVVDITRYLNKHLFGKSKQNGLVTEPSGIRDNRNQLVIHPRAAAAKDTIAVILNFNAGTGCLYQNRSAVR